MAHKVAIVVINFSHTSDTLECLDSLAKVKTKAELQVYVVHYQANKGLEQVEAHAVQPTVIVEDENLGFAGMNNVGMRQAVADGAEYVMLLNNDTTVQADFVDPLLSVVKEENVGLVSPKIYFSKGKEFQQGYQKSQLGKVMWYGGGVIDWENVLAFHAHADEVDEGHVNQTEETDFATGCCVMVRAELIEKIGVLPEKYFMYLEDVAWNIQFQHAGFKSMFAPASVIWHKNASASGGSGSDFHVYYQTRNRILFAKEYAGLRAKLAVMREAWRAWRGDENEVVRQASIDGIIGRSGFRKI